MSINFKGKKFEVKQEIVHVRFKDVEMKTLNLRKKKIDSISNLIGLENLLDLEALILDNNRITEIEKIPDLKNLKYLSLKYNNIHDIKIMGVLPQLIELNLAGNELDKVPGLGPLPSLTILYLANNKISEINNLETMQNLEFLFLDNNLITEIKNLESLKRLTSLSLPNNQITEVKNLNELHVLRYLFLQNNRITRIFPIHLKYLDVIDILGNPFHTYLKSRFSNLTPQKIIEYSIDSEGLEKRLMVGGSNIYVPIDSSNILKYIPENEIILYSTQCNVKEILVNAKSYWKAHLIITESGIAITVPLGRGSVGGKFFEWNDIWEIKSKGNSVVLLRNPRRFDSLTLTLSHNIDFESNKSFSNRIKSFPAFCILQWEKYRILKNFMPNETYYCYMCGAEIKSEDKYCTKCGADNELRLKKIKKLETVEKRATTSLSSPAIRSGTSRKSRAKRVRAAEEKMQVREFQIRDRIRRARTKLIIGNTHEGKLNWVKKQHFDLKRTIQDIANDLGESMITVKEYLNEIEKQDITEKE